MNEDELKKITQKAQSAVKDLDPELKSTAFKTILDKLLTNTPVHKKSKSKKKQVLKKNTGSRPKNRGTSQPDETAQRIIDNLNRTEHSEMFKLKTALDRSILILQLAKDQIQIDGLMPLQISHALWHVFRLKATQPAVSMALMNASKYVDRKSIKTQGGSGFVYHLMHDGEKYIKKKLEHINNENKE